MRTNTLIIKDKIFTQHLTGSEIPEVPGRYDAIEQALEDLQLSYQQPSEAKIDCLLLCHTKNYIDGVKEQAQYLNHRGPRDGSAPLYCDDSNDTRLSPKSFKAASYAVGAVIDGVEAVLNQISRNVFCLVRPPGHHACANTGMGFCLFNNVAIGAKYALEKSGIDRALIVDWDAHHGNGTEELVAADPRIFYFSTHQSPGYPGTGFECDETTLNVPIHPDQEARVNIIDAFQTQLLNAMDHFQPNIIFISCGFDALSSDPIAGLNLTVEDFGTLTDIVMQIANQYAEGRIISVLEGGYNLEEIGKAARCHVSHLTMNRSHGD